MSPSVYRSVLTWSALCGAAGVLAVSVRAADHSGEKSPDQHAAAKLQGNVKATGNAGHIEKSKRTPVEIALDAPVTLKYNAMPLHEVAATLSDLTGVNVLLDGKSLGEASVKIGAPVDYSCEKLPLNVALEPMLAQLELGYIIAADNTLLITTWTRSRETLVERVYDVHDLLTTPELEHQQALAPSHAATVAAPAAMNRATLPAPGGDVFPDEIVNTITSCVEPTTWTQSGGSGSITLWDNSLVVEQTDANQREIARLLEALRTAKNGRDPQPLSLGRDSQALEAAKRIRRALEARDDFDLRETPLKDFADFLRKLDLPVMLDTKALTEASITPDTTINFHAKNMRVADALRLALGQYEMGYRADHGAVLITTESVCKERVDTAVYPAGDLLALTTDMNGVESLNYDELLDLITTSAVPTSWTDAGGSGAIAVVPAARALVISQTEEGHAACARLLTNLRSVRRPESPAPADPNELVVRRYPLAVKPESIDQCITIVKATIELKSWSAEGVYTAKIGDALVIRQTRAVHKEVLAFLNSLGLMPAQVSGAGGGAF